MLELIRNAEVFAPEPLGLQDLLIASGAIQWIGRGLPALPRELAVHEVDLGGRRVIPGLIDGHVHLTGGGGEQGFKSRVPRLALSRLTRAGTTTIVGLLGTDDVTRQTAGLVGAVRGLNELGFTAYCHTGGYHIPPATLTGSVRGDIVHVDVIIGVGEVAISDHRSSQPTLHEILRLGSEAYVAGMLSGKAGIVHLHVGDGARGMTLILEALDTAEIPPRVWNPTHVNRRKRIFKEALALAERGVVIDVTAYPVDEDEDAWGAVPAIMRYLDAGLPPTNLTVSSDCGGSLPVFDGEGCCTGMGVGDPQSLGDTLAELVARGRALETVLPFFTANVARLLRLPAKGRLAVGCDADLVVLDARHRATDVMARGRWHVQGGVPVIRGMFETGRD